MKQEDEANLDANAVRVAVAAVEEQDNDDDQDVEDKDKQIFDDMVYLAEAKRLLDEQRKAQAEAIVIQAAFEEISKAKQQQQESAILEIVSTHESPSQNLQRCDSIPTNDTDTEGGIEVQTITPKKIDNLAPCGRIGLVALATDFNIEDDGTRDYAGGR